MLHTNIHNNDAIRQLIKNILYFLFNLMLESGDDTVNFKKAIIQQQNSENKITHLANEILKIMND